MIRGWCPTLAEPMETGDGWLARVRPRGGVLRDPAAFAAACLRFGNGIVEVTSRGALQVRGLGPPHPGPLPQWEREQLASPSPPAGEGRGEGRSFADEMVRLGLDADERIVFAPMFRHCEERSDAAIQGSRARFLDCFVASAPRNDGVLHPKIFLAIDGGPLPMGDIGADMTIRDGRLIVGGLAVDASPGAVAALLAAFLSLADAPRRFAGVDPKILFAAAGLTPAPVEPVPAKIVIGPHPAGFVVGLPFGAIDAAILPQLARLSGDGTLRPTPWRAFVLPGTGDVSATVTKLGLIADPADPRLRVAACPGGPGCASGTVPARSDAATLRPKIRIHVSGCAKGCAHPGVADATLVGEAGLYNVVRNGRAGDAPSLRGLTFAQAVAAL